MTCQLWMILALVWVGVGATYVTTQTGTIDIILTSNHGGFAEPSTTSDGSTWPDRTHGCYINSDCVWEHGCGTPDGSNCRAVTLNDKNTRDFTVAISNSMNSLVSKVPYLVLNDLARKKLDTNREVNQATFGIADAVTAYNEFQAAIVTAKNAISSNGLLVDIHGHAHHPAGGDWIEVGYAISKTQLNNYDYWASMSTIHKLADDECGTEPTDNDPCFESLIYGDASMGAYLNKTNIAEYRAVPSPNDHSPGTESYFTGGYIVRVYGSRDSGSIDAIQLEFYRSMRDDYQDHSDAIAKAILCYYKAHYDSSLSLTC